MANKSTHILPKNNAALNKRRIINKKSNISINVKKSIENVEEEKQEKQEREEEEEEDISSNSNSSSVEVDEKEEVERKIKALQRVVPGGESLGVEKLFEETASYIMALQCQLKAMKALASFFESLDKEKRMFGG
ncbi:hypothetical protein L484_021396 [Morus notabilis]|uniref:BHLH domain-containing protein n=1 Tax=Morus notabilis TaxID=981085 RepID=W9RT05_9ROSA|nr:hypothetical protein L484_021396 [Morus notabilis]